MTEQLEQNIVICGRLGKTPELRYSKNKQIPMCLLDIAENKENQEEAIWHKVIVWGEDAQHCTQRLKTGMQFFIQGNRQRRKYTDREGNPKSVEEVKAKLIGFPRS